MQYGLNKRFSRAKVPVQVLRGFSPTEPDKLSSSAPPIDDEAIYSGMVIVKDTGDVAGVSTDGAFRKAAAADSPVGTSEGTSFYVALHDQDSHDVQASGGLVGLDCSDDYEVQTGYFDTGVTYVVDMPLTVGAAGVVTEAASGDVIIGYVTKIGGGTGNAIQYVGKTLPTADAASAEVVQFKTARNGQFKS